MYCTYTPTTKVHPVPLPTGTVDGYCPEVPHCPVPLLRIPVVSSGRGTARHHKKGLDDVHRRVHSKPRLVSGHLGGWLLLRIPSRDPNPLRTNKGFATAGDRSRGQREAACWLKLLGTWILRVEPVPGLSEVWVMLVEVVLCGLDDHPVLPDYSASTSNGVDYGGGGGVCICGGGDTVCMYVCMYILSIVPRRCSIS